MAAVTSAIVDFMEHRSSMTLMYYHGILDIDVKLYLMD